MMRLRRPFPWFQVTMLVAALALLAYSAVTDDKTAVVAAAGIGLSVLTYGWGREDEKREDARRIMDAVDRIQAERRAK